MNKETEPVEAQAEPIPIDREEFMFRLEGHIDFLKDTYFEIQMTTAKKLQQLGQAIVELEDIKAKVIKYEDMGLGIEFSWVGDELKFKAHRRKPMGFNVNNDLK